MSMEPAEPDAGPNDMRDMAPASDNPINDDDDDKTEPAPEQLTKTSSVEPAVKCDEDYCREPADLSKKTCLREESLVQRPFRLDPEDVARFSRDPEEWLKTFRVPAGQQSRVPDDKARQKPVDYTTINNNNIVVQQLLGQQLLGNRNAIEDGDVALKKKRSRSKKRRSGSDVADPTSGAAPTSEGVVTSGATTGLTPGVESNSPPVVLDVVCGQNQASLCLEKLKSGSKTACVLLNGAWLTPNQYQHVSGRGTARDWKRSIKHNGTSLKALLASKVLTFDPPSCRCNLCLAISSHAKENSGANARPETRADQENEPPRGVDSPSAIGDGAKSPSPLIRTSKETTPTIVCGRRDSAETEDYDEEEEDEEEEEEEDVVDRQKEEDEEEDEEDEEEEEEEEEEDWKKKRALMDALSLKELPRTTIRCLSSVDDAKPCRKRKALQQGDGCRASKKMVKSPDGPPKEKRVKGSGLSHSGKSSHGLEKVRRSSENDAVVDGSDWTMLNTSDPGDLCRVLSASTGATSSLGTEAFKAMQQRASGGETTGPNLQKEETLTHIIHELRNYKKSLEEKIVASRRTSHVTPKVPPTASGVPQTHLHWSPSGKDQLPPVFQRRVSSCSDKAKKPDAAARTSASQDGCGRKDWSVKGAPMTKVDGSDEKQLPDLVRSHNPSTITTTTSSPAGLSATTPKTPCSVYPSFTPSPLTSTRYSPIARYVVDHLTGAKYECDEHGVIDLSTGKKHPTSSNLARPIYSTLMGKMDLDCDADSDGERVLDLSVTSKVKVEHRTTPKAATEEQRGVQKRKRLSDGHSRRAVQKRPSSTWTLSPGKILGWTVADVAKFVADVPECGIYAETFKQFGVTGPSLVCLSVDQMTAILRMRLNAAQSLRSAIDRIVAAAAAAVASA